MDPNPQPKGSSPMENLEIGHLSATLDDDGRPRRTGTLMTASAHIITAVIGSGVLSLAWANAQLGWIAGPIALSAFSVITYYTSTLLADCYRNPETGERNCRYINAVKCILGGTQYKLCGIAQYVNLVGTTIGYTVTASISMAAIERCHCFHKLGHDAGCHVGNNGYMIIFGVIQAILSQIPNFSELSGLSVLAAIVSFAYSSIGVGLSIAKIAEGKHVRTSLTGVEIGVDVTTSEKIWNSLAALGNIAFAYAFSMVLVEIQDTLKSSPPETQVMKKATLIGSCVTTVFYMACGILGYAAFGNKAPGNILVGFGFFEPFWLIDIANLCIIIHLVGAYQVFGQPIFQLVEDWCSNQWSAGLIREGPPIPIPVFGVYRFSLFRLIWRTVFVVITTVVAMIFPFFNDVVGLLGACAFWPLTVYFPIEMHIARARIQPFTFNWMWLKALSMFCLTVSLLAALGSIQGLIAAVKTYKPFTSIS